MQTETMISGELLNARHDLNDTKDALAAYWSRGSTDADYKIADVHMAAEALMRAVSSIALIVEQLGAAKGA